MTQRKTRRIGPAALAAMALGLLWGPASTDAAVRLKDVARLDVTGDVQLVGYGLVVGLDGTGDTKASAFTMQSMSNLLTRMGVSVPEGKIRARNTAAVMVTARLGAHHRKGAALDVTVSSIGDAKSLQGGTLLLTPLATADGTVYAMAQGPLSVGGFSVRGGGSDRMSQNYVLAGRVPGGAVVETERPVPDEAGAVTILLHDPDFTTAGRVAAAINAELGDGRAEAMDAGTVLVSMSDTESEGRVTLLARIEAVEVEPDAAARVVVNEKTGTIVAGEAVTLSSVAIAHGNLSVEIRGTPHVSQPAPFSQGETAVFEDTSLQVTSGNTGLVAVEASANVGDLARALNTLGVGPRDMIAIFQALKEAGALRAELRIL